MKCKLCFAFIAILAALPYYVYGHSRDQHTTEIGEILGLCNSSGKVFLANRINLHRDIGDIVAELIDSGAPELNKKLNSLICDELKKEVSFGQVFNSINERIFNLKKSADNTKKLLSDPDKSSNFESLDAIAVKLNWIADELRYLPPYDVDSYLGDEIYSKRNQFSQRSDFKQMRSFLIDKCEGILKILIYSQKNCRAEIIKARLNQLARDQKLFSWGEFGHRLYFHWGYTAAIISHDPLRMQMLKTRDLISKISPKSNFYAIEEKIYNEIELTWRKKKDDAEKKLASLLEASVEEILPILSISYDCHILGDYSDVILRPLMSIPEIRDDLCTQIDTFDVNDRTKLRYMRDIINHASRISENDSLNAAELLKTLKRDLPILIDNCPKIKYRLRKE